MRELEKRAKEKELEKIKAAQKPVIKKIFSYKNPFNERMR